MKNGPPASYLDPPVYYESEDLETPPFIWDPPFIRQVRVLLLAQTSYLWYLCVIVYVWVVFYLKSRV